MSQSGVIAGRPVALEILAYLVRHPEAKDSLKGITEWWLVEERIRQRTKEVKAALALLVGEGFVEEQRQKDGHVFYRLNRAKEGESQRLLKSMRMQ